jgi:alpha-ketoglutarate-dependent taurine dioxygenase
MTSTISPGATGTTTADRLDVRPLTVRIGAEIAGVDLASGVGDATIAAIRRTLLERRVVFFRGQHLDGEGQIALARRFGELTLAHPTIPSAPGKPALYDLDSLSGVRADQWHTDVTFIDQPPTFSFLRAVVLPPVGGDTLWASTIAGYECLKPELARLADHLRVVHTNNYDYGRPDVTIALTDADAARIAHHRQFTSTVFETEHPLVRVHPETNERALLLGAFAQRVVGFRSTESVDLIRLFQNAVTKPENTVRWKWQEGDVVIWDNRSTQHYATFDYGTDHRQVQRVTTVGEVPVSLDGRPSTALSGNADFYNASAS